MDEHSKLEQMQTPLHRRIAENIGNQVSNGALKPGQKLPSERQIARQFNASRATVRTALQHLEQAGLISRRERRSAVVSIRRDITPYLRIACSDHRLCTYLTKLSDMQILPPRCQLQQVDLQHPGSIPQLLTQPTMGVDVVICGMEYVSCLTGALEQFGPFPQSLIDENQLFSNLRSVVFENDQFLVVPLAISPMVLYYNRALFRNAQLDNPRAGQHWNDLVEVCRQLKQHGQFGLQFRPTFDHISAIMGGFGASLYQANGHIAAKDNPNFDLGLRFVYEMLHAYRCTPILAKAEQINLFLQQRCAMALDSFDMFRIYQEALGHDLGVMSVPCVYPAKPGITGMVAVSLGESKNIQPVRDMLRTMLGTNSQRILTQLSAGLPVRSDLLSIEALQPLNIQPEVSQVLLNKLQQSDISYLPYPAAHKAAVDSLLLELWLGLDQIEGLCERFKQL